MKNQFYISFIFLISTPFIGISQNSFELTGGAGYTAIDIEELVEQDEVKGTFATDWGQASYGISGQYFFAAKGNIGFGAELMYQYWYWYNVSVPFGTQRIFREYSVSAFKVTPIVRFGTNSSFAFDIGPEINFSDGIILGILLSANYNIRISDNIEIPIKVRVDIIDQIVVAVPITLNTGIRIKLQ